MPGKFTFAARPVAAGCTVLAVFAFGSIAAPRLAAAWPVGQDSTVTLDDFTGKSKSGAVLTIKHAEFQGTNLTKDEIVKIFTPDGSTDEVNEILRKMKVASVSIPTIDVAPPKGGAVHIHDIAASDIDTGKVGKFSISSVDGAGQDEDGPISIKSGAMLLENADIGEIVASIADPKRISPVARLGHLSLSNIDLIVPDKDTGPGKTMHLALGSLDVTNNYDGDAFKDGSVSIKGMLFEPGKESTTAASLGMFGYSAINMSANISLTYDSAGKNMTLKELTVGATDVGAITVKAALTDVDAGLFGSDEGARTGALLGSALSSIEVKVVNAGIFEKSLAFVAAQQKSTADAVKQQWMGAAGQMLPAVLGGDPSALKLAGEAQKFISAPSNLTVSVRPKSGSFKFMDAMSLGDPMAAIAAFEIVAVANK